MRGERLGRCDDEDEDDEIMAEVEKRLMKGSKEG